MKNPEICPLRSPPRSGGSDAQPPDHIFQREYSARGRFHKGGGLPPQKQPPAVSANGKRLTVDFRDSLKPDATYTVDFGDAIKDLNEGNVLDGFAIDFSTGPTIDTLRISGLVLEAETLEPAQGILVGVYSNLSDTAISTLPMERIARTNQLGQFTIRNLPHGRYRIFALNDLNRDYHWDRSEDIAFYDSIIVPYAENIIVSDTLYSSTGADSLVAREGIRYMPNDILLTWFNTGYKAQYLTEYKRPERRRITLQMGAPSDSLPQLTIVDGAPGAGRRSDEWAILNANATRDTLEYWLSDPDVVAADSLRLAVRYLRTDTTDRLAWTTDTLRFFFREPKKKEKKKKDDEPEAPLFVVDSITGDTTFLPPPDMEWLALQLKGGSQQDVHKPLIMTANLPLARLDSTGVHLEELVDTVWTPRPAAFHPDSVDSYRRLVMDWKWIPGAKYRLTVDTMAATSIYGPWNRPFKQEITVRQLEDYSNLTFTMPGTTDEQMVVQLLNSSDAPLYQTVKPRGSDKAELRFLTPALTMPAPSLMPTATANGTPVRRWILYSPRRYITIPRNSTSRRIGTWNRPGILTNFLLTPRSLMRSRKTSPS